MSMLCRAPHDTTLRLEGEVGRDRGRTVEHDLRRALNSCAGEVWLDLGPTVHLHYEVAQVLVQAAASERRLHLVGATPYVRQILRLASGVEEDLHEPRHCSAAGDAVA